MDKTVVAVGDSTRLEIIFSTKTYKSKVSKRPKIQTNEGPPNKHVTISATVTPRPDSTYPVVIKPYKLDLSQFSEKLIDEAEFTINNRSDQELGMKIVAKPIGYYEIKLPDKVAAMSSATCSIKLDKEAHEKSFEKSFTIEFYGDKMTRFTVPVKRTVRMPGNKGTTKIINRGK